MWLMRKTGEDDILVANYEVYNKIKDGWATIKMFKTFPENISKMKVSERSIKNIRQWYLQKIALLLKQTDKYKNQYEEFEKMLK